MHGRHRSEVCKGVIVCVCVLLWSLPLRSSSSPNRSILKSRHDSLQLISCPTTELSANGAWFNSGNNSSPKKKAPPNTTTWHPISWSNPTLCLFWGASFLHTKSLLPQGAARSISWEETPRGEQCELEGRIKVYEAKNLLSRRTHNMFCDSH